MGRKCIASRGTTYYVKVATGEMSPRPSSLSRRTFNHPCFHFCFRVPLNSNNGPLGLNGNDATLTVSASPFPEGQYLAESSSFPGYRNETRTDGGHRVDIAVHDSITQDR